MERRRRATNGVDGSGREVPYFLREAAVMRNGVDVGDATGTDRSITGAHRAKLDAATRFRRLLGHLRRVLGELRRVFAELRKLTAPIRRRTALRASLVGRRRTWLPNDRPWSLREMHVRHPPGLVRLLHQYFGEIEAGRALRNLRLLQTRDS